MAGVEIVQAVRTGPANLPGPNSGQVFLIGVAERGPRDRAVKVTSLAGYEAEFGGRQPFSASLYDSVRTFFEEGGYQAIVARVVGAAAAVGTLSLLDRQGTAVPTLRVDAIQPGAWSTGVRVEVVAGTTAATYRINIYGADGKVEAYDDLATVAAGVEALLSSKWVRGTDLGSPAVGSAALPALRVPTALSAGSDDRAAITSTTVIASANLLFGKDWGTGAVAAPGYPASAVGAGLLAHAKATRRVALLAGEVGDSDSAVVADALALAADGQYAGIAHPWVTFPLGSGIGRQSPEAFVAATRARAHATIGPWQVPAGERGRARFITGTVSTVDQAGATALSDGRVIPVATIAGITKVYGWRSCSTLPDFRQLTGQDAVNAIADAAAAALEPLVFATIDGRGSLLSDVYATLDGLLQPIARAGGFFARFDSFGNEIDAGYSVQVSPNVTGDEVSAQIAIRLSPTAEWIRVTIVKAALAASV